MAPEGQKASNLDPRGSRFFSSAEKVAVLSRRAIDIMIVVAMPLSYTAFSQTLAKVGLIAVALALHAYVQPIVLTAELLSYPCVRTQASPLPKQWLAWDMGASCDGQSRYLSAFFVLCVAAAGPLSWLALIAMTHVFPEKMPSFLAGGYKHGSRYWEVGGRKDTDTVAPRTSPRVRSGQNFEANPAVATRAPQDEQRYLIRR